MLIDAPENWNIKVDESLGLSPKNYVQDVFAIMFVREISETYNYLNIVAKFKEQFSTTTISNLLKRLDFSIIPKKLTDGCDTRFCCTDGIYLHEHKKKQRETKSIVLFTGVKKGYKNSPNKLLNKVVIPFEQGAKSSEMAKNSENLLILFLLKLNYLS